MLIFDSWFHDFHFMADASSSLRLWQDRKITQGRTEESYPHPRNEKVELGSGIRDPNIYTL